MAEFEGSPPRARAPEPLQTSNTGRFPYGALAADFRTRTGVPDEQVSVDGGPDPDVRDPLFIVGTGRCGSTVLQALLSRHPRLAWLTQLAEIAPAHPALNGWAMRLLDVPPVSAILRRLLQENEAYALWSRIHPGFPEPCRDLRARDATPPVRARAHRILKRTVSPRRSRLLLKLTGWPRIGFLRAVFPGARFVHIYRDGRCVAASLLEQEWWSGWRGPGRWRWGPLSTDQRARWERHDRSFAVLAGLEWELLMDAFEEATREMSHEELLPVRYEDLCREPEAALRRILDFADLPWMPAFARQVRSLGLRSANDKWRRTLTPAEQDALEEAIAPALARHGFL